MIFDVTLGVPVLAAATSAQSVFDTVINSVIDNGPVIAGRFAGGCYMILTVCIGIRLCKAFMEAIYDDSIVSGVADAIQVVVTGLILLMGLTHIPEIAGVVWAVVDETMGVMDLSGSSGGAKGIATNLMNTTWSIIPEIFDVFFQAPPEEADKDLVDKITDTLADALNFSTLLHVSMGLMCVLMALIYAIIISVQVAVGLMQITVGIAFLPVTLAFYPIIENWAKNAIGTIAAGIAHMGICAFLISMVSKMAADLTEQVVNGGFTAFGNAIPSEIANKAIALLALGAFLLVLGLSTGKAVGFATGIFGSVGGMIGRTAARGGSPTSSGASAGKTASSAGKAAGNAAMEGGAKAGAAGVAKAGTAVAGAASGAATAGVGTVATAAAAAGGKAMDMGGKAAMGAATGSGSAAGAAGLDAASKTSSGIAGTGVGSTGGGGASSSAQRSGGNGTRPGGPQASFGEKAGMAAALVGAAAMNAGGKAGAAGMAAARRAASPAGMAVRKAGAYAGQKAAGAVHMAKAAPKALMKAQLRSTING